MPWLTGWMVALLALSLGAQEVQSQEPQRQTLAVQCRARQTGIDGARHTCRARPDRVSAPPGYVLAEHSLVKRVLSRNGTGRGCWHEFSRYVEVVPGIHQPTVLTVMGHARSPRRRLGGAGWIECEFTVDMIRVR